jgi:parvulin-like peptidyl-prolyl isomerase
MSRSTRASFPVVAIVVALAGLGACGSPGQEEIVARVGAVRITKGALDRWTGLLSEQAGRRQEETARRQALRYLIATAWRIGEAEDLGLKVSTAQVAHRLGRKEQAAFPGGQAELRAFLQTTGQTASDLALATRAELASARVRSAILASKDATTAEQIAAYYIRHMTSFAVPERRQFRYLNRKSLAVARRVRREVELGARGAIGWHSSALEPAQRRAGAKRNALETAIYSAKPHVLTGPVKLGVDYYLIEVTAIRPAGHRPLAQVKAAIARRLAAERARRALAGFTRRWNEKWTARTSCAGGYVVADCRQYRGRAEPETLAYTAPSL